ncbi:MAG: excinuclease ABC subunit C [Bacteroidales bacterium]|nr:excinuclease ABC subunit C [Bacteroidales bacterium]
MNDIFELKDKIKRLPESPGVYQFLDKENKIIYIGKAINVKKRVNSYFVKNSTYKIKALVKKISDIHHIIVDNESEALLLENSLIKKFQPKYNIQLKDDKTYPWICIKKEKYPRVFSTRNHVKDGSEYYGPFTSAVMVRTLLDLIRQLYPIRTCNFNLSEENISNKKFKKCLEYHIGKCKAPCENLQSEDEYMENIEQIRNIVKGNLLEVLRYLKHIMNSFAGELKFEEAEIIKNKIEILEKFRKKSTVVNTKFNNLDVFSYVDNEKMAVVNYFKVHNGAIIRTHILELIKKLDENQGDMLSFAISEISSRYKSLSKEIIVPFSVDIFNKDIKQTIPTKGDKKKLLELSERNAKYYFFDRQKQKNNIKENKSKNRILEKLKEDLHLNVLPNHIECFDNSNIQGSTPVASCVVFKNGIPSKNEYRHFNIKTVEGANDFASMSEIIYRRYKRLILENKPLPQLIIIDGGKGQLNAALKSLEKLNIINEISVISIAKKLEEIFFPGDPIPLYLDKRSESLKIIQQLRNEAHRFGITFHRKSRISNLLHVELENIDGIGEKTIKLLFNRFKDVNGIKKASQNEISDIIGEKKAKIIKAYFS